VLRMIRGLVFCSLAIFILVTVPGCGTQDSSGSSSGSSSSVSTLLLSSDVNSILSNGIDEATLTVRALDQNNAAVSGAVISLRASGGVLSDSSVTTNNQGYATFYLESGAITSAEVVTISASSGSTVATETVSVLGTTVTLTANTNSVGLSGGSTATLTAYVRDGSGDPIEGVSVSLDSDLGTINGSSASISLITNSSGMVTAEFAGGTIAGTATITLTGPETKTVSILISDAQFKLTDTQGGSFNISTTDGIKLTWIDSSGNPVANETVSFEATKGTFDTTGNNFIDIVTDSLGQASTVFHPTTVGADTILVKSSASSGNLQDTLALTILAGDPATVTVNVNPSVVSRSSGGVTPEATVSATVLDANNRAVQGVEVAFSLIDGPGGGEGIFPAKATTNAAGVATTIFSSGGQISRQEGVTILAKVVVDPSVSDTVSLTIANQPATIVIGETNKIVTLTIGDAEDVYALPFTVLVTDTNGSAIPNQEVSLSVYPTYFRTGYYDDNTKSDSLVEGQTFANEDVNRNGILDTGEDTVFVNGRLDPGGVVAITSAAMTDSNGFAGFNLTYAKSFGNWVDVEITATTNVSGTESTSVLHTTLKVKEGDTPFLNSPFNDL